MQIFIDMEPVPKARARVTTSGYAYTPQRTANAEAFIRTWVKQSREHFGKDIPLSVEIEFYLRRPKSCPKNRKLPTVKPDTDNLVKCVCDACNGVLWDDDCQICDLKSSKRYREKPGILLTVRPIEKGFKLI